MKYIKYLLPALATACLLAYAIDEPKELKILPKHPASPPKAQFAPTPAPIRLNGAEDGIPYGLHVVSVNEKAVTLQWNNPEPMNGYFDDFEGHSDFVINSSSSIGWDYLDQDNANTYTWAAAAFPNQGQKMAYIIMNPSKTAPSTAEWPAIKPFSGNKMLVAFCASAPNNDYIISPELNFTNDFQISFQAKSYTNQYGLERIRVGYSTTGKRPSDFIFVTKSPYEEVPAEWTLKQYNIPKEAKYVTINCVSNDAFMLLIDDIFIGTNIVRPKIKSTERKLTGFNLYRNGMKVNQNPIEKMIHIDNVPDYGDYKYTVSCLYSDNSESDQSTVLHVNVPDTRIIPFEDNFSTWTLDPNKWSMPEDEKGNKNLWKIDYFTYGLVDPSATYAYSRLENYSQSLITRELRTLDPDNTFLRFELRLLNYKGLDGDTLSVEVTCDNKEWKEIKSFCNGEGTFTWRVEQFSLKEFLAGQELFRIRFRVHGLEAFYLDYWYVDDIKVWNPQWTSARLTVNQKGSPLAECPVTLTADHGAVLQAITDANGNIDFPKIEKGKYEITILKEGYNPYKGNWEVEKDTDNQFTAMLTHPVLNIDNTDLTVDMKTEETITRSITLKNEGDGPMKWTLNPVYSANSGDATHRWEVQRTINASSDLQSSVAFDGENYYTASWYYLGKYYKYDKNGKFLEEFSIPGMYYKIYDLAFDGNYFYGSDKSNMLFQLDFRNKRLIKEIVIKDQPNLEITHCSYDSRNDQFWVGGFNSIGRVDRKGDIKVAFRAISNNDETSCFGSAFDQVTPGGPYLWFSNQVSAGSNSIDKTLIIQYNINTRNIVSTHSTMDLPGYKVGNNMSGPNFINGLEAVANIEDGTFSLIGILQQSPSLIFVYKLCDANTWFSYAPKGGVLEAGNEQKITVDIDARNGVVGQSYTSKLQLNSLPDIGMRPINITYRATGASDTPRPSKLTGKMDGTADVKLTWEKGNADKQPIGYNVYRNGKKVTPTAITQTEYSDKNLLHGKYTYTVTAIYGDNKESAHSDKTDLIVKLGAPYYPPTHLMSIVKQNQKVLLSWQLPNEKTKSPTTLRWDNGTNEDALGLGEGGYFWVGTFWDYDDLIDYRGMSLDEVNVFIKERCMALSLKIYKDDDCILTQVVKTSTIKYGEFNTVKLETPLKIEAGYTYKVTFLVMHDAGLRPIGIDNSTPVENKGNIVSTDGSEWFPATYLGMYSGNFNISIHLLPAIASNELTPTGYNVYRNGTRINETTLTERVYDDPIKEPGIYKYQVSTVYEGGGESKGGNATEAEIIEIGSLHAPSLLKADVELNRKVRLRWNFPLSTESSFPIDLNRIPVTRMDNHPEFVHMFRGRFSGELAIASDGEFIYTSMFKAKGTINKYGLDGEFIESFDVNSNLNGIRSLTYDGNDFYAADCNDCIFKVDMDKKVLTDTLSVSEIARHLSYIPELDEGRGGFEVGDWETGIYTNKKGAKIGTATTYKGASGTAYYNGILYAFEQGYDNRYSICMYDFKTGKQINRIDLQDYTEITPEIGASAGDMTVITTKEGLHLLGLALQEPSNTRFIFLDLDGVKGVEGYNVYCNNLKVNEEPLKFRYFEDNREVAGEYAYEIETVYIDGNVSEKSQKATIEIVESGECNAPIQIKARQSTYPYNVVVSFVNPATPSADTYESTETGITDSPFARTDWQNVGNYWLVTEADAYHGSKALTTEKTHTADLIVPVDKYESSSVFSFVARNSDDHFGSGALQVLASPHTAQQDDFSQIASITTTEEWKQYSYQLPIGTKYVAIRYNAGVIPSYVDAVSVHEKPIDNVYGYDIYRDGKKLNEKPVINVSYTDHNLTSGNYSYQIKAHYTTSCISDFSEKASIKVEYSNDCQKPGQLSAEQTAEGTKLNWSAPSLGEAVYLKWHSGDSYGSAGMPSGGSYFAGVQWNNEELKAYKHMALSEVEVYINQVPDAFFVLVYEGNNVVHQQYVPELKQRCFNTITLDRPIPVNADKSLKVVIYVEHNEITVPIGYDKGPAKSAKGDLYSSDGITWSTLGDNQIDANWNITIGLRAYSQEMMRVTTAKSNNKEFIPKPGSHKMLGNILLTHPTSSMVNTFDGYNLYCNSELVNKEPLYVVSYTDQKSYTERYLEYRVAAIYSGCGEVSSNTVRLLSTGIETYPANENIRFYAKDTSILIDGIQPDMQISMYDMNGKMVYSQITGNEAQSHIYTVSFEPGIYLIKVDNVIGKVVVSKTK